MTAVFVDILVVRVTYLFIVSILFSVCDWLLKMNSAFLLLTLKCALQSLCNSLELVLSN